MLPLLVPFFVLGLLEDYLGMLQRATGTSRGSEKTPAHLKAKHVAYGLFL
jgi:hypothetical protein